MEESDEPAPRLSPAVAFQQFLTERAELEAIDFAAFCAARPAIATELRCLYDALDPARRPATVAGSTSDLTLHERPAEPYGEGSDRGTSLPSDAIRAGATLETLERLEENARASSRYVVRGEIARGGMGVILKVWDRDLRRDLAMKLIAEQDPHAPGGTPVDERVLARFLEEAQITGQLEHPGILPVHELGLDAARRVFFTMPLMRGRDLKEIIDLARAGSDDWTMTKALSVILKICEAVAYAHSRDVVHRDLKPANVMVGHFGETYVMDWGLARVAQREDSRDLRLCVENEAGRTQVIDTELRQLRESRSDSPLLTMDGAVVGTPAYMSPEQAKGRIEELGPRSDVYSIGAILYHLLVGHMPYVDADPKMSPRTVLLALLQGPPRRARDIDPEVSEELAAIAEKAMARDPSERYADCLDLARDIEAYLGHRPVAAHRTSVGHALRLAFQRNRPAFLIAGAAAIALMITGVLALWKQNEALAFERLADEERRRSYDIMSARALPDQVAEIAVAVPSKIPLMETWMDRASELLAREPLWRDRPASEERNAVLSACESLRELERTVRDRIAVASDVDGRLDGAWRSASEAIATSPQYAGPRIAPVESLLPLGADPETGLWEFWNPSSGQKPHWDPASGCADPAAEDAIVMVLLPAGHMPNGSPFEGRALEPFFAGKYEVTQAQWTRVTGFNPALYRGGLEIPEFIAYLPIERLITTLHPVESVSWDDCQDFARRAGLELLTDVQWEYACRAGTETDWSFGDDPYDAERFANILDQSNDLQRGGMDWNDHYPLHAPVGVYQPNSFGLHDMHGNVWEWTASQTEGDWTPSKRKIFLGGSYLSPPPYTASSYHSRALSWVANQTGGLRVGFAAPTAEVR